jgi:membrane protein YdbS with pleckstrin-like domain
MNENILKIFYFLFVIDILIGIILFIFVNWFFAIVTAFTLLFINFITFVVIKKMLKVQQKNKESSANKYVY